MIGEVDDLAAGHLEDADLEIAEPGALEDTQAAVRGPGRVSVEPLIQGQVPQVPAVVVGDIQLEIAVAVGGENDALSVGR